jgi:hypothetical protein
VRCASRRAAPVFRSSQQKFFLKEIQDDSADNKRADRPWRFDKVGIVGHLSRAGGPCKTASAASFNNLICNRRRVLTPAAVCARRSRTRRLTIIFHATTLRSEPVSVTGTVKFFNETKGYITVNARFPASQPLQLWPDVNGTMHQFQTTAQWQAFATAMGDFVAATDLGQTPVQPVTIP